VTAQKGENSSLAMSEILSGTTTKDRLVPAQASVSMCVNSESVSNEIDESDSQYEKYSEQRISTRRGIVTDSREEQFENAFDSMCVNPESVSNEIDESDSKYEKHAEQRI
jgi:hypothetical protein